MIANRKTLNVEAGLFIALVGVGLVLRLYRLGLAPLSPSEAGLALAALRGTAPPAGASPLLYSFNSILFSLLGASDGLARLLPALAGAALAALPALLRDRLGRVGALGASAILAISPVAVMTSRTTSGQALAGTAALALLACASRFLATDERRWLWAAAASLGIGLASGASMYTALIALGIGLAIAVSIGEKQEVQAAWKKARTAAPGWGIAAGVAGAAFVAAATGILWRPTALAGAVELIATWLGSFTLPGAGAPWYLPLQILVVYEAFTLVMGMLGLFFAAGRRQAFPALLATWGLAAMAAVLFQPGRTAGDTLLVIIPLALLGAYAFEALAESFLAMPFTVHEGETLVILAPFVSMFVLGLAAFANNAVITRISGSVNLGIIGEFLPAFLAIVLITFVALIAGMFTTAELAARATTLAVLGWLALAMFAAGWGATQNHPGDPRELLAGPETTAPEVRTMLHDLALLSADRTMDTTTLPLVVQPASDSVLGWYLRDMIKSQFQNVIDPASAPAVLLTAGAQAPALAGSYTGQRYTLRHAWQLEGKQPTDVLRWMLYRKADQPRPTEQATLWLRQGE